MVKTQPGETQPDPIIPRPEPIGQDRRGQDEYLLDELVAYRMSRHVTQGQLAQYLHMSLRSLIRFEQDPTGTGRTSDYRCRDYILGVEKYVRGQGLMVAASKGRWRSAQEARAILDAQQAENDARVTGASGSRPAERDDRGLRGLHPAGPLVGGRGRRARQRVRDMHASGRQPAR